MRHCRRHLAQCHVGFTGHQPVLLQVQHLRRPAHDPEQPEVDQRPAYQGRRPDQHVAALDASYQVLRLLVDLHHGHYLFALAVEQRNVVLDEQVARLTQKLLLFAVILGLVVAGRHRLARAEGAIQIAIGFYPLADQLDVGGPDDGAVAGVDIGQQSIRQMLDMVEKFDPGRFGQRRGELQVLLVQTRVKQFTHGGARWQLRMAYLGLGHGLNELRGQHRITLHAIADHKARGHITQPARHRRDDQQADDRKPAQQVELTQWHGQTAGSRTGLVANVVFQHLHRVVPAQGVRSEMHPGQPTAAS
ncbi:hypothetical protein D3C81_1317730 [compost metagenome]